MRFNFGTALKMPVKKKEKTYYSFRLTFPNEFIPTTIKNKQNNAFFIVLNLSENINIIRIIENFENKDELMSLLKNYNYNNKDAEKIIEEFKEIDYKNRKKRILESFVGIFAQNMLNETTKQLNQEKVQIIELDQSSKQKEISQNINKDIDLTPLIQNIQSLKEIYSDPNPDLEKNSSWFATYLKKDEITKKDLTKLRDMINNEVFDPIIQALKSME